MTQGLLRALVCALLLAVAACAGAPPPRAPAPGAPGGEARPAPGPRAAETAAREMVAAANPLAAAAALQILKDGGNALDAAIAAEMVLTLVEPQSSGIGGGGFLMHFDGETGEIAAYEGREAAPAAITVDDFLGPGGAPLARDRIRVGGISVAVPGALRMLERAHERHGKLPWRRLFAPAIQMARDGFAVSPRLHAAIRRDRFLADFPAARAYFFDAGGRPLAAGARLRNPALAETLEAVADGGAGAFYEGAIAADIAAAVQSGDRPGKMTEADLAAYQAKKRPQLCGPYRSWLICGFGPPTAGGVTTLMTLALLERFDLGKLDPNSAQAVHLFAEAMRLANADRLRYVADPDLVDVPVAGMLDFGYLARRSDMIREATAMPEAPPGEIAVRERRSRIEAPAEDIETPATTHLSIVDKDGNAVAMTASVGESFGSRLLVRGFMLNDHATDFSFRERDPNRPEGGKRPRSSQAPTFVFDGSGRLVLAVGSPGGTRIIAYVVKTLIAVLDWKMDIQAAIALPNRTLRGNVIELENATALEEIADALRRMGHEVRIATLTSGLQGIAIKDGMLMGGADPRREGVALGD